LPCNSNNFGCYNLKRLQFVLIVQTRLVISPKKSKKAGESGSAGESHPHAPTDRYVTVSRHTAPASIPFKTSQSQAYAKRTRLLPRFSGVDLRLLQAGSSPSLQSHYRPSSLLRDDPPLCFASVLSFSWDLHLNFSLNIETTGSHVPHKSLTQSHATFTPEAA